MKQWYEELFENYGIKDDLGNTKELECNERYYVPSEITWLLKTLDFKTVEIFGAKLGAFSRNHRLSTEDYEMLVIAQRLRKQAFYIKYE